MECSVNLLEVDSRHSLKFRFQLVHLSIERINLLIYLVPSLLVFLLLVFLGRFLLLLNLLAWLLLDLGHNLFLLHWFIGLWLILLRVWSLDLRFDLSWLRRELGLYDVSGRWRGLLLFLINGLDLSSNWRICIFGNLSHIRLRVFFYLLNLLKYDSRFFDSLFL